MNFRGSGNFRGQENRRKYEILILKHRVLNTKESLPGLKDLGIGGGGIFDFFSDFTGKMAIFEGEIFGIKENLQEL